MNHVLCPACFAKDPGEEKCCSHGCYPGARCVGCGKVRAIDDEYWPCLGTMKARLDADGTAKPLTEIVGVFPAGKVNFYNNAQELIARPTAGEWRCECPSNPEFDTSINPACVKACGACGAERPTEAQAESMRARMRQAPASECQCAGARKSNGTCRSCKLPKRSVQAVAGCEHGIPVSACRKCVAAPMPGAARREALCSEYIGPEGERCAKPAPCPEHQIPRSTGEAETYIAELDREIHEHRQAERWAAAQACCEQRVGAKEALRRMAAADSSSPTPLDDAYDEGYKRGRMMGHDEGFAEGQASLFGPATYVVEAQGTFECPVCGRGEPHPHDAGEVARWRGGKMHAALREAYEAARAGQRVVIVSLDGNVIMEKQRR